MSNDLPATSATLTFRDLALNEALVRGGWAVLYTVPPNVKYASRVERAQKEARASRAGLWNGSAFECSPSDYRRHACPPDR